MYWKALRSKLLHCNINYAGEYRIIMRKFL
jgi:hypothetical protein